jgi:hypothetical protein
MRHDGGTVGRAPGLRLLVLGATSAAFEVISSQAKRNVTTSAAANTSSTAPSSRLNATPRKTDRRLKGGWER